MMRINLSRVLWEKRWTQADLARKIGIRPDTISDLYHELIDRVNLEHLDKICEVLECDLTDILKQDNPKITEPKDCRYDTCLVVSDEFKVENKYINFGKIIGGKYCVFKISHTAEAMQKAWIEIFSELSRRNYEFDDRRPIIERYAIQMINKHFCEICVPIL